MRIFQICPYCKETKQFIYEELKYPNFTTCPSCHRDVAIVLRTNTSKKLDVYACIVSHNEDFSAFIHPKMLKAYKEDFRSRWNMVYGKKSKKNKNKNNEKKGGN